MHEQVTSRQLTTSSCTSPTSSSLINQPAGLVCQQQQQSSTGMISRQIGKQLNLISSSILDKRKQSAMERDYNIAVLKSSYITNLLLSLESTAVFFFNDKCTTVIFFISVIRTRNVEIAIRIADCLSTEIQISLKRNIFCLECD